MIFFCDYLKPALEGMANYNLTNEDIQEIFNKGWTESQTHKFLDKDGFRTGIYYQYDGRTMRYVIITVYRHPLKTFNSRG